ncbi:hypothetical protein KR100_11740 [Synechococcus sp. KORDI-100]|uniref:TrmH family RNA methyltransferase n=1 Tax=Synechococcus sp. KORDI-100 TaxID=1280380 RepID=UPI0004E03FDE|nr:RNA methyltransferase [Synechococcus sp. KORDI-100]AII44026.1 hypothetical protein KR100_11740 [Synechococcus sp. KORDI-100]
MVSPVITSRRNPLVRRLRALTRREGRDLEQILLLEGTHLLEEALQTEPPKLSLIATEPWIERHPALLSRLPNGTSIQPVSQEVLSAALSTVSPDGVASLLPLSQLPAAPSEPNFLLVLDRLQDPGNLGTLLRTALAAEVETVWLGSGADPLSPKALRSSAGALLHLPHTRLGPDEDRALNQLEANLQQLRERGLQVVATLVPEAGDAQRAIPYWELDWERPTALVLGNEGQGLHQRLRACCTHSVTLPHSERVESLNVAAAAVPLLLERRRARMTVSTQQSV